MTDRTLSAAALDWLQETAQRRDVMHLGLGLAGQEARMQLIALDMARRTEAAERENKSLKAALDSNSGELLPALAVAIHRAETAERKLDVCEAEIAELRAKIGGTSQC